MMRFRVSVICCCLVIVGVSGLDALGFMTMELGGEGQRCPGRRPGLNMGLGVK